MHRVFESANFYMMYGISFFVHINSNLKLRETNSLLFIKPEKLTQNTNIHTHVHTGNL